MVEPTNAISEEQPGQPGVSARQLAALSHEFRTPLNGVLGMAGLLEGTGLSDEQRTYVVALRESGEHLLGLVNDLLDFAKLGAGAVDLHPGPVDLEALLRSICELLAPRAQEKGLELAWAVANPQSLIVADEGRLRQILLNFAANAVKFTPGGGVLLTTEDTPAGRLRFTVTDTGPGVPIAERERIFAAFAQLDPAVDSAQLGGAGLGLAIARTLALAMGGQVGVDEAQGGGAVFWFEAAFSAKASKIEASLTGRTVGIASANMILAEAAKRQIEASGGQARTFSNLHDPGTDQDLDVLLVDNALAPQGLPIARPCLILLAPGERTKIAASRQQGYAGYLIKPLRRASVVERVLAACGRRRRRVVEDDRVMSTTASGARVLLVEDNAINALLAKTLLSREGCAVDLAANGPAALSALEVADYDLILMDMRMPGLSGIETTQRLRALRHTCPVVALTANAFEDDRHACLEAGMNDFLVKPLSVDALRLVLAKLARGGWTAEAERAKVG